MTAKNGNNVYTGKPFQNTGLVYLFLKQLNTDLPYHPAIPLLRIFSKKLKTGIQTKTCTHAFIVALLMTTKNM